MPKSNKTSALWSRKSKKRRPKWPEMISLGSQPSPALSNRSRGMLGTLINIQKDAKRSANGVFNIKEWKGKCISAMFVGRTLNDAFYSQALLPTLPETGTGRTSRQQLDFPQQTEFQCVHTNVSNLGF